MAANVLIVEDEVAISEDLQDILEMAGHHVIGSAFSYDQAIAYLAEKTPDLCFLDIALEGNGSGLDVAEVINKKFQIPFIFLTSFSDEETIDEVITKNPSGYLVKPFKEKDIAPMVALAIANDKLKKKEVFPDADFINNKLRKPLSPKEYQVLKLLWQGCKNAEIADFLFVSINTIKTHVAKIYFKLDVNSRSSAINKVMNI